MKSDKWYRNPEMLVALSALSIGILTAVISIYSAVIDRAYARASVWPKLEVFRSYGGNSFRYGVSNKGTGPAIIHYAKVTNGGKVLRQWADIAIFSDILQSHIGNITLPSGQTIHPLTYEGDEVAKILEVDSNMTIELCYCSIYQQCWIVDRSNRTQETEACVAPDELLFLQ